MAAEAMAATAVAALTEAAAATKGAGATEGAAATAPLADVQWGASLLLDSDVDDIDDDDDDNDDDEVGGRRSRGTTSPRSCGHCRGKRIAREATAPSLAV